MVTSHNQREQGEKNMDKEPKTDYYYPVRAKFVIIFPIRIIES